MYRATASPSSYFSRPMRPGSHPRAAYSKMEYALNPRPVGGEGLSRRVTDILPAAHQYLQWARRCRHDCAYDCALYEMLVEIVVGIRGSPTGHRCFQRRGGSFSCKNDGQVRLGILQRLDDFDAHLPFVAVIIEIQRRTSVRSSTAWCLGRPGCLRVEG